MIVMLFVSLGVNADWVYKNKVDPMTDIDASYVYLSSNECNSYRCQFITLRSDGDILISFGKFMNRKYSIQFIYRFDKEKPVKSSLLLSTSKQGGFIKDAELKEFYNNIKSHKTLIIIGYDYNDHPLTITFDLVDSKNNINKISAFKHL